MTCLAIVAGIGLLSMLGIPVIAVVVASADIAENKLRSFFRAVGPWIFLGMIAAGAYAVWADSQRLKEMRAARGVNSSQR